MTPYYLPGTADWEGKRLKGRPVEEVKFIAGIRLLQIVEIHNGIPCLITEHNPSNHISFLELRMVGTNGSKHMMQLNLKDLTDSKVSKQQEYDPVVKLISNIFLCEEQ